jgi:2-dehydro-3-deoxygalactonokinase
MIAVDWGTSSLRGARLDGQGRVLEERQADRGILHVPAGGFQDVFESLFGDWWTPDTPCLMAGMVGSRQGWAEAPYCPCPAGLDDLAGALHWLVPGRLAIVPGLCQPGAPGEPPWASPPDVMRGEEVQIFGALDALQRQDATLVLPGTHSKWVQVRGGRIESFRTHMTGECFQWLRHQSLLARTLPEADAAALDTEAFTHGVRRALQGHGLLHNAFGTRTLALFEQVPSHRLGDYLSGLVIGEEIRHEAGSVASTDPPVVLIGAPALLERYRLALTLAHIPTVQAPAQLGYRTLWRLQQLQ